MRILALITDAFGGEGGIARFNRHFLTALSSMNGKTSIIALPRMRGRALEKIPSRVVWKKVPAGKWIYSVSAAATIWKNGPFDWIFCGHIHLAPLARVLSRWSHTPFWLQLYGIEALENPSSLIRWAVKKSALVTAVSRFTRRKFLTWSGVDPQKVKVLPCTVDERFQPGPKPDYLLRRYGLTGKKVVLTLSRLSASERYKGQERILELMPQLLRHHPNLVYVIAGDGDDRARLEKIVREKNLGEAVHFIGHVKESELVDIYRMADLFVMPSTGEGFGIAFLEAVRSGVPVVGGKEDGSYDALLEGQLGQAVNVEQSPALALAMEEALQSRKVDPKKTAHFSNIHFNHLVLELAKKMADSFGDQ